MPSVQGQFPTFMLQVREKEGFCLVSLIRTATGKNDNYRGLSFPGIGSGNGRKGSYLPRAEIADIARNAYQNTSEGNVRLRSQKSSTEIPTFFGRPLLLSLYISLSLSLSLRPNFQHLRVMYREVKKGW